MKAEEIQNKTNEAVAYLVEALESGQSEVLTEYLNAMARFHNYSFGNIMLIAPQRPTATREGSHRDRSGSAGGDDRYHSLAG